MLIALNTLSVSGQDNQVSGNVSSADDGDPIPGVNIVVKGTSSGTITDLNGDFSINVEGDATLVFTSVGYESLDLPNCREISH